MKAESATDSKINGKQKMWYICSKVTIKRATHTGEQTWLLLLQRNASDPILTNN